MYYAIIQTVLKHTHTLLNINLQMKMKINIIKAALIRGHSWSKLVLVDNNVSVECTLC